MKIYTKTGDKGKTSLFGGERVSKSDLRLDAYGTVDELNSFLGLAVCFAGNKEVIDLLEKLQNQLFTVGSDLASPREGKELKVPRVDSRFIEMLEDNIDRFEARLPELRSFILPGGSKGAAYLHAARSVCRRAERITASLSGQADIGEHVIVYLNRLSDLLFVLARYDNFISGTADVKWNK